MTITKKKRQRYKKNAIEIADRENIPLDAENWEQIWALLEKHGEPDYLYAIVDIRNALVKFGKSKSPGARLRTLKIGNGMDLKIFAYCKHESPMTEKEVHSLLRGERVAGEWFKLSANSQSVIDSMRRAAGV